MTQRDTINVLITSAWDPTSGVLTVYRSLNRHLRPRGVRYSAYAFDGWREDTLWTFCDELIDGRDVTLARVLMSGRYDLVHAVNTAFAPPWGVEKWVRRARFRGPVVLMAQSVGGLALESSATRYVACSAAAADALAPYANGSVRVIPNGYDETVFKPGDVDRTGRPRLIWVGRTYDEAKDIDLFLAAVELLPDYEALIVDDGTDMGELSNRLAVLGSRVQRRSRLSPSQLADAFRYAGASGGAFVSTSRSEGFNIAAVEAMACGCPVIVPRIAGHAHLVDGQNAIVFDRALGARAVADAVSCLSNQSMTHRLVETARRQAETDWTSRTMAEGYLDLYHDALSTTGASGLERATDPLVRNLWRAALLARPTWRRVLALARA